MSERANKLETLILASLIHSEEYSRRVLPHLAEKYFESGGHRLLYLVVDKYVNDYNKMPSFDAIAIELDGAKGLSATDHSDAHDLSRLVASEQLKASVQNTSTEWLVNKTQTHCLDRSVYLAIMDSLEVLDGSNTTIPKTALPELLREAINVSFDSSIGHNYLKDAEERWESYNNVEDRVRLPLEMFNTITKGGFPFKTMNLIVAPTGVGKTFVKGYFASHFLKEGHDVLYVTLEMAEELIAERIDANLMDIDLDGIRTLDRKKFLGKIDTISKKTQGNLIIKQYPAGAISTAHIRGLMDELKMKEQFEPKVVIVDYLNLLASARMKSTGDNSYGLIKAVSEELRALAVERNVVVLSSTQTNRSAAGATDFDVNEISESFGTAMTADFMIGCISTPELEETGQMRMKQLKNRYASKDKPASFLVGIDRSKMQMFDVDTPVYNSGGGQQQQPAKTNYGQSKSNIIPAAGNRAAAGLKFD